MCPAEVRQMLVRSPSSIPRTPESYSAKYAGSGKNVLSMSTRNESIHRYERATNRTRDAVDTATFRLIP